jgi:hypothetical protein
LEIDMLFNGRSLATLGFAAKSMPIEEQKA